MTNKLKERIDNYASLTNYKLLPKVPIIISLNIRGAQKLTTLINKPYDDRFTECLASTMVRLLSDIEGAVFGYIFSDEIVLVIRNDQNIDQIPWLNNQVQRMVSAISSISTTHFNTYSRSIGLDIGDVVFITNIFTVPNITETINAIISKQQQNFHKSIEFACLYELLKKGFNKNEIKELMNGLDFDGKVELLKDETGIIFSEYDSKFRRGLACFRVPQVIKIGEEDIIKDKWKLDDQIPTFTSNKEYLRGIFRDG